MQTYKEQRIFWNEILKNFCLGLRSWKGDAFEGASPNCSQKYLNRQMIYTGFVFAFENDDKFYISRANKLKYNYMHLPTEITVTDYRISKKTIKKIVGKDCIYIPLTTDGKPLYPIIDYYARKLARINNDSEMNSLFCRSSILFKADDDPTAQKVRKVIDDIEAGKMGIFVDNSMVNAILNTDGKIKVLSQDVPNMGYDYISQIRETLREFCEILGINSSGANLIKKERNISAEVDSNNEFIGIFKNYYNSETKKAINEVNKMFNQNIQVEWGYKNESIQRSGDMADDESLSELDE